MKNHIQPGRTITVVSPAGGLLSGQPVVVGALFGISCYDAAAGLNAEIETEGVFALAKPNSVVTFAQGEPVFFDAATSLVKKSATGFFKIGVATEPAAATDSVVHVRLDGVSLVAA
jgi:predicted RecA/RadA family phage recombinase